MARYRLIGAEIQGQDENEGVQTMDEQHVDANAVVYETDDYVEAVAIKDAGGFFRNRDNFVAVDRMVDTHDPQPRSTPTPRKGS